MNNSHVAPPGYIYQHQLPHFPFISDGDCTPIPVRGMPQTQEQTQQPSTYAALPPIRSSRKCFSAVAPDRRSRPPSHPWEILRGSFRSRSIYSRSFADRQCSHQRHPEVLRQRLPRVFIGNPKQQHSTKRRPTPG